jgi:hypothetical protein
MNLMNSRRSAYADLCLAGAVLLAAWLLPITAQGSQEF